MHALSDISISNFDEDTTGSRNVAYICESLSVRVLEFNVVFGGKLTFLRLILFSKPVIWTKNSSLISSAFLLFEPALIYMLVNSWLTVKYTTNTVKYITVAAKFTINTVKYTTNTVKYITSTVKCATNTD